MKAVSIQDDNRIGFTEIPYPSIQKPSDVIVKITTTAICGSDIHAKNGVIPGILPGTVIGHEFVGEVQEVGSEVIRFNPNDRVAAPAAVWCGKCSNCKRGEVQYCANGGVWGGGSIFGNGLGGAQTSFIRVPYADNCLTPVPDNVSDNQAVFLGDVFSTGYHAAYEGKINTGDVVAVYGCGPIGLAALISSSLFGPSHIYAVDMLDNRLALASEYGATAIDSRRCNPSHELNELTNGLGVDVAIEASGSTESFTHAIRSVRRGGNISIVGLFSNSVELPINELAFYGIRISMGLGNLSWMNRLISLLESKKVDLSSLVTHTFPLDKAIEAYDLFENHKDDCVKILLKPQ